MNGNSMGTILHAVRAVALMACFSVSAQEPDPPRLANISTRGQVLTGHGVMIAGFIVQGDGPLRVVITVAGPSLNAFGLDGIANPTLTLVRSSDQSIIATNDDWQSQANAGDMGAIYDTGFQPNNAVEPAIIATLPPGAYTAIVQGVGGGTGIGLVSVYDVDSAIRSGVIELIKAAEACKKTVAEYYQTKRAMPTNTGEAGCSDKGTAYSTAPAVTAAGIKVWAAGILARQLVGVGSLLDFMYEPGCPAIGACTGAPIQQWFCNGANTTISKKYLPATCR